MPHRKNHQQSQHKKRQQNQQNLWRKIENFLKNYELEYSPANLNIFKFRQGWFLLIRFILLFIIFIISIMFFAKCVVFRRFR